MQNKITSCFLIAGLLFSSIALHATMQETAKSKELIADITATPDGISIRTTQDGDTQIFSCGRAAYDFDDQDDILQATKQATLRAKANIAKFLTESLQTEQQMNEAMDKVKTLSQQEGQTSKKVTSQLARNAIETIKTSSTAMLTGIITLSSAQTPDPQGGGTCMVIVGVSTKTLHAVTQLHQGMKAVIPNQPQTPALPAPETPTATNPLPPHAQTTEPQTQEGWILCIGNGKTRKEAVTAALVEGIQQVYGVKVKDDNTLKSKVEKIRINMTEHSQTSLQESTADSVTMAETAGLVQAYRIQQVTQLPSGLLEARVYAKIVPPRGENEIALLVAAPTMLPHKLVQSYKIAPDQRLSGHELTLAVGTALSQAMTRLNQFYVITPQTIQQAMAQQQRVIELSKNGLVPESELQRTGRTLAADLMLTAEIQNVNFSQVVDIDTKTGKFAPVSTMFITLTINLMDATNAASLVHDTLTVKLDSNEINAIRANEPEPDFLGNLLNKTAHEIQQRFQQQR